MLRPDMQWKNPVMFVVEIGAVLTLLYVIQAAVGASSSQVSITYFIALDIWLFLTVLFANFATAIAEERGKAQAETLRRTRIATPAFRRRANRSVEKVSSADLQTGRHVIVDENQVIPGDGEVIEGVALVNEAAITGESAPVIREAGGDRSGVTGGTTVISDRIVVRISAGPAKSFLDKMIALVEGARRQRTPNEIALTLVLTAFTLIFMIVVVPLWPMASNAEQYMTSYVGLSDPAEEPGNGRADAGRADRLPDPDDDRRVARRDRHRRHGPRAARQHHRQERQGGGGRRRYRHRAARQDRHDHARRSARARIRSGRRHHRSPISPASPRSPRSPMRRRKARASSRRRRS